MKGQGFFVAPALLFHNPVEAINFLCYFLNHLRHRLNLGWKGGIALSIAVLSGLTALSISGAAYFGALPVSPDTYVGEAVTAIGGSIQTPLQAGASTTLQTQSGDTTDLVAQLADPQASAALEAGTFMNKPAPTSLTASVPSKIPTEAEFDSYILATMGKLGEPAQPSPLSLNQDLVFSFDREAVIADSEERIAPDFKVPEMLKDRVAFWFDIYTKYDSNHRIIHHSRFPWIVFKVIDVTPIITAELPRHQWLRNVKADKFVASETAKIRAALKSLARRRTLTDLSEDEQLVADALAPLKGDVKKQAKIALGDVRVQTGQRNFFKEGLEVSPRYLLTMERIFRDHNLPTELTRIPFVESSFNKHATSKVGASGIWQFMDGTGRKFMQVDQMIDERRSPFKATEGAARLLKENFMILHRSWPLAITAWNHGPPGVRKAIQKTGSQDLSTIVAKYHSRSFDFASANFFSEFLAALHAEKYSDLVFGPYDHVPAMELDVVKLPRAIRFKELLRVTGLSVDDFLILNPDLSNIAKRNLAVPRGFRLHVPEGTRAGIEGLFAIGTLGHKRST